MLTVVTGGHHRDCQGRTRRDFLRVGALGLGGLTLSGLLAARARAAAAGGVVKDKSIVLLFLSGGASHIETFDPKMTAPSEVRSVNGELRTSLPGVTFGGSFPRLARLAHRMAVVRSFHHTITNHPKAIRHVLTGGDNPTGASMGSIYMRLRGANHPRTGLPTYATITSQEVDPQYIKERPRVTTASGPGSLGLAYAPFDPAGGNQITRNMELSVSRKRLDDRRALLAALDRINRQVDARGTMEGLDKFEQQAFDLILGGAGEAFDLSKEDPRVVERYDTSRFRVGHQRFRDSTLGTQMLMARRLCEAGCGFVTVHSAGWDMHADRNNPGMVDGMRMLGPELDHAASAFLEDVEARGLSDQILLVITGDFGRTPRINKRGGRDHWASLCTLAFAGGGLNMGQVIGRSARNADVPNSEPITPQNLMATLMHTLFDVPTLRLQRGLPRQIASLIETGQPIRELF